MSDGQQWISCPACKGLRFAVVYQPKEMLARVQCEGCNRELLAVSMAPPEEPLNTRVAPI